MAISYETVVMPNRAQEATNFKMSQLNRQSSEQPNIQMAQNLQKQLDMTRTTKAKEKDETPFNFDAKNKGSNEYQRQELERKKKEEEKKKQELKKMLGCTFDITV